MVGQRALSLPPSLRTNTHTHRHTHTHTQTHNFRCVRSVVGAEGSRRNTTHLLWLRWSALVQMGTAECMQKNSSTSLPARHHVRAPAPARLMSVSLPRSTLPSAGLTDSESGAQRGCLLELCVSSSAVVSQTASTRCSSAHPPALLRSARLLGCGQGTACDSADQRASESPHGDADACAVELSLETQGTDCGVTALRRQGVGCRSVATLQAGRVTVQKVCECRSRRCSAMLHASNSHYNVSCSHKTKEKKIKTQVHHFKKIAQPTLKTITRPQHWLSMVVRHRTAIARLNRS